MITPYYGEFLTTPAPLEMSMNFCSHKCAYCFANLNKPDRKFDAKRVANLLAAYPTRSTVEAMLLQRGYPTVISNHVDPFAVSNYQQMVPIMEQMTALDLPIMIQTKGGRGIDQALGFLKLSVWYISIAFADDAKRKTIEPGAPTIESRYELIAQLVQAGHSVVVGLNPLVREWLPDVLPTLERIKAAGASGVWIEYLHFNHKQLKGVKPSEIEAMGADVVKRATKRKTDPDALAYIEETREAAKAIGLEVFSMGQPTPSSFFQPWVDCYGIDRCFPTSQDLVNWCWETKEFGDVLTFDEWAAFVLPRLPSGEDLPIDSYIGSIAHDLHREYRIPPRMSYKELLAIYWQAGERIRHSPVQLPCFAYAYRRGAEKNEQVFDNRGWPVLAWTADVPMGWWCEVG